MPYSSSKETQIPEDHDRHRDKGFYARVWPDILSMSHTGRQTDPETLPNSPTSLLKLPVTITIMSLSIEELRGWARGTYQYVISLAQRILVTSSP